MGTIKLFCLPFGGGSAMAYHDWKQFLSRNIELSPIELAARGRRMGEANYDTLEDAVNDVFNLIKNDLLNGPYAIYGHCLGCMILFELAHKIRRENLPSPFHLFFSGRGAPQIPWHIEKKYYKLPEDEFRQEAMKLGGLPQEALEVPELLDMIFTLLRGDYKIAETYSYVEKDEPLDCDITILSGLKDEPTPEEVEAWEMHTRKKFDIQYFNGGHFFLLEEKEKVVDIINAKLENVK